MEHVWWMECSSLSTLPHLLTQMHNRDVKIYKTQRQIPHTQPWVFLRCSHWMGSRCSRLNLPSFPRDSSSFWIWFSRKNMATANASSARSCILGGIMTRSSPIKSSRKGFGQSMLRGGDGKNRGSTTVTTKRRILCAWPSLPPSVWISPDL